MQAHRAAALKLPNRRRIVFSDGLMPAWVHDVAVGEVPCSTAKRRTASSAWSEARLPFKPNRSRRPPNSKVFELCMAGSTQFLRSEIGAGAFELEPQDGLQPIPHAALPALQLIAFLMRAATRASSAEVNFVSAYSVGQMAPSSRLALSLKPSVAYRALNLYAPLKKKTRSPSLA